MKKKLQHVIRGSLAVGLSYLHIWLVRLHILSPAPDPFFHFEENI